ncbi:MCE family protein [Actinomadura verrucosospora]|uniref:Virulence factor Mce family protein n=1 Tax=Actinomadura verrucosospora TaxID=46165 RepID=A0A7D4AVZ0_ACTVE|nr:MlaD family protein [Actinomadura verrucosospora]QKG27088.1 virulence factor Mce family protein [Actinomadura verrucosospora]
MLTIATRIKLVVFALLAVLVTGYIAVHYADLGRYVGMSGYYTVHADLAQTGGLFPGSSVTYRGIEVGKVGGIRLHGSAVRADLHIDHGTRLPSDLTAAVANRSAVGEQYIDLRPRRDGGPYLHGGSVIAAGTPAPVTDTLQAVNDLAASVPLTSLRTLVTELGAAFTGQGPDLQALLDKSASFTATADAHFDDTLALIQNGNVVLATQNQEADALKSFAADSALLARRLRDSDADLRTLITAAPPAGLQISRLLRESGPDLSVLLANLTTGSRIAAPRTAGIGRLLADLPALAAVGVTVTRDGTINLGTVNTFFNPLPCVTGYGGTPYRDGLDVSRAPALNTGARCALPASSGVNVRGSANAPHHGVPEPASPGGGLPAAATAAFPGALSLPATPPVPGGDMAALLLPGGADR